MRTYNKIITPFLIGQRRDGLCRIADLTPDRWEILEMPTIREVEVVDVEEQILRMSSIYLSLSQIVTKIARADGIPVSIGCDCVSALGVLAGLQKANKEPDCIVWLDAHGDFHTGGTTQTNYIGGMPLAMLVGRGDQRIVRGVGLKPYPEHQIILSDARDVDPGEREALQDSNIVRCDIGEITNNISKHKSIYLHFDTDIIDDEAEVPALKYHVKFGPSYLEVLSLFCQLSTKNIIAVSISSWHEEKDRNNKTAATILRLLNKLTIVR